jgi:hypothetical protein
MSFWHRIQVVKIDPFHRLKRLVTEDDHTPKYSGMVKMYMKLYFYSSVPLRDTLN